MAPINFNTPISPTPDSVMGEVIDNICQQWNIDDAWQALPNGLSYNHAPYAMAWGQPFLILLSDLASLTPGRLEEVQERLRELINYGRKTKGRHSWAMPDDLKALVQLYGPTELETPDSANGRPKRNVGSEVGQDNVEQLDGEMADDEREVGGNAGANDDQDGEYTPSSYDNSSHTAISTALTNDGKRKADERIPTSSAPVNVITGAEPMIYDQDADEQELTSRALQVRDDIESWREAVPTALAPRAPPSLAPILDSLGMMDVEQGLEIPPEFTPEQKMELLHILKGRNLRLMKDAEFDFRIRLEEVKRSRQSGAGDA
ncbi:hypothetical protein ACET3X_001604 [Alternaria dauci]|uniref:Uncharacterized protein n=1 Tax=Alternaria dauci TaxID=48095 RepID=A0ABR3UXT9_9PLEO